MRPYSANTFNKIRLKIMKLKRWVIYILVLVTILGTACATQIAQEPTEGQAAVNLDEASDGESSQQNSPLESPLQIAAPEPPPPPVIEAEYDDETGAVTGLLRARHTDGDMRTPPNAIIGLGELIASDDGDGDVGAAYSPTDSPRAAVQEDGTFAINNVKPGKYAVILDAVTFQSLMRSPDDSEDFLITIEAGEPLELGILEYEKIGFPGFMNK